MTDDLSAFKTELTTFLKTSAVALSNNAATLTPQIRTVQDKNEVLRLVTTAISYMDLVMLVKEGIFDGASD